MGVLAAAGFVVFRKAASEIEYLLLQTSYGQNHWTPPKGHVDPGETEMVAAIRETKEESALLETDLKIYEESKKVINYVVRKRPKVVTYWLAELINYDATVQLSDEHQDFKWLPLEEACSYAKHEEMVNTLKYFDNYIKSENI